MITISAVDEMDGSARCSELGGAYVGRFAGTLLGRPSALILTLVGGEGFDTSSLVLPRRGARLVLDDRRRGDHACIAMTRPRGATDQPYDG